MKSAWEQLMVRQKTPTMVFTSSEADKINRLVKMSCGKERLLVKRFGSWLIPLTREDLKKIVGEGFDPLWDKLLEGGIIETAALGDDSYFYFATKGIYVEGCLEEKTETKETREVDNTG